MILHNNSGLLLMFTNLTNSADMNLDC